MATQYIHFTEEQKQTARQTDIAELLRRQGQTLKRSGSEYEWKDGSAKVTVLGNLWFHQYDHEGGDAIDFVRRFMGKSYPEAVEFLLNGCGGTLTLSPPVQRQPSKPFVLPEKNENMRRVYAYLLRCRGLDRDVVNVFVEKNMIYESAPYHNAVFVGYDRDEVPRHAHKRGSGSQSTYKGNQDGSLPEYAFHWHGQSDCLYLFEAPIDLLSFLSLHKENWQAHSYTAACGVSDQVLWQMMKDNPGIRRVCLCLDHDAPGQAAARRIAEKLNQCGIPSEILVPIQKDWNEDLLFSQQEEIRCPTLQL